MRGCEAHWNVGEPGSWPRVAALRIVLHRSFRLEPVAPGAQWAFQFLRDRQAPSGSEAFRLLCVSLYAPLEVKKYGSRQDNWS